MPDEEEEEEVGATGGMDECGSECVECFCPACMGRHEPEAERAGMSWEPTGLVLVPIYPRYQYTAPSGSGATERDKATERVVHNYLVRVGKLPPALPHIKCSAESASLTRAASCASSEPVTGFVGREDAMRALARAAATSSELLVVLRGHGAGAASLAMSDGTKLTPSDIRKALERAGFSGRVLCAFNMCHATDADSEGPAAAGSGEAVPCFAWDDVSTFEWAALLSSGKGLRPFETPSESRGKGLRPFETPSESRGEGFQRGGASYGFSVMRVLERLLKAGGLRRAGSITQAALDDAWAALRKDEGGQDAAAWRVPPRLHTSRGWGK